MSIFLTLKSSSSRNEYAARLSFRCEGRVRPIGSIGRARAGSAIAPRAVWARKERRERRGMGESSGGESPGSYVRGGRWPRRRYPFHVEGGAYAEKAERKMVDGRRSI